MMNFATICCCALASVFSVLHAQVPTPMSTNRAIPEGAYWTKTSSTEYILKDNNGKTLSNVKDLNYLKTDTLGVFDRNSKTVYLLADFKDALSGSNGKAVVLAENVTDSFYLTNPYSFYTVIDGKTVTGKIVNVKGSYLYYVEELGKSYYLKDIRNLDDWGAKKISELTATPDNTYWFRNVEKKSYGVIVEGETIDYSKATTEADGNDLVVSIDGVKTYVLPGYYTMASFVITPAAKYSKSTNSLSSTGCVSGDCENGWGKWQFEDGYYDGFWESGKRHGYGLYKWNNVGKYIGNWDRDNMSGYGVYIADNKDNIVGEYKNGQLNGLGYTIIGDKGSQGIYSNGRLITSYSFTSNNLEVGCTIGDCQNQYGQFKWENGDSYIGFFKNGNLHMGSYTFASGDKYSGMFNTNNQFHGVGRFFFKSGEYYGGSWKNGKYDGLGYYHDKDLVQQIGEWANGAIIKKMK